MNESKTPQAFEDEFFTKKLCSNSDLAKKILLHFLLFHESIERKQKEKALLLQGFQKMRGPFFDKNVRKTNLVQCSLEKEWIKNLGNSSILGFKLASFQNI